LAAHAATKRRKITPTADQHTLGAGTCAEAETDDEIRAKLATLLRKASDSRLIHKQDYIAMASALLDENIFAVLRRSLTTFPGQPEILFNTWKRLARNAGFGRFGSPVRASTGIMSTPPQPRFGTGVGFGSPAPTPSPITPLSRGAGFPLNSPASSSSSSSGQVSPAPYMLYRGAGLPLNSPASSSSSSSGQVSERGQAP
jgi:hypothetical protein